MRKGGRFCVYLTAASHLRRTSATTTPWSISRTAYRSSRRSGPRPTSPVACVFHHVHQAQFDMYFRWPVNRVARLLESRVSRRVYRDCPMVAVSPSTRAEMRRQLGIRQSIHIVPNGTDPLPPSRLPRSPTPAIAVVTRLVPHKRLHLLVSAVPELLRCWPDLRVDIAGTGTAREALLAQVQALGLERVINLPGRVSEQIKSDLLARPG